MVSIAQNAHLVIHVQSLGCSRLYKLNMLKQEVRFGV